MTAPRIRRARVVALVTAAALPLLSAPLAAQQPAARPAVSAADDAAVRSLIAAMQTAWNARDAKGFVATFHADADQILGRRPVVRGRDALERDWSTLFQGLPQGLTIRIDVESIRPVTRDVMVVDATGNFSGGRAPDGSALPRSSDRATFVVARDAGRWALAALRVFDAEVTEQTARGIEAARERFVDAWRRNDAAGAAAVFTADAINMIPGAPDNRGREAIQRTFADFLGGVTMESVEFTPEDLGIHTYEAFERGTFVQRHKPRDADAVTLRARYMAVWRREPGGDWQLSRFLFNELPSQK